jgi:microcystin-dependent protein
MDGFLGEIRLFAPGFTPKNWAPCFGQTLAININQALFSILGTTYGGDGTSTFGLPNLAGRSAIGVGRVDSASPFYTLGQRTGTIENTLNGSQLPAHTHTLTGSINLPATSQTGNQQSPAAGFFANDGSKKYDAQHDGVTMRPATVSLSTSVAGGSIPFNNLMPYLVVNYIICMYGIFPQRQ